MSASDGKDEDRELIIATRGSELALAQAQWVEARLESFGVSCTLLPLVSRGDQELEKPLAQIGGKGLFTREIDDAVLEGKAHLAVHSLKDLPALEEPDLVLAAVPLRESDRDVLALNPDLLPEQLGNVLESADTGMPEAEIAALHATALDWLRLAGKGDGNLRVGCGSPRRIAQFQRAFPGVQVQPVRGNIPTRLRKMHENGWAGLVLAEAALRRLRLDRETLYVPLDFYPAPGQGALGIRTRRDLDETAADFVRKLDDPASRARAEAERSFLREFAGGCHLPAGLRTYVRGEEEPILCLEAGYFPQDGAERHAELCGALEQAEHMGAHLARQLLSEPEAEV